MLRDKKLGFVDAFDVFWDHVRGAEEDVRKNRDRGRLPPICHGDPWDEDFAHAYTLIRPNLRKFREDRFFAVPAGLAFRTGPLRAETAHQALMFFLNPPAELYGEAQPLDSQEYRVIKKAAMDELERRDKQRLAPWKPKRQLCSSKSRILGEISTLKGVLKDHHFPEGKDVVLTPLTLEEIQAKFGWSQATATRRMQKLFKWKDAMAAYTEVFSRNLTHSGYLKKFNDDTLNAEAIFKNGSMDADGEESEEED